ncbi:MAG: GTPase HflX [Anaerosomatales bacterium]|nr:GTPase HflX [Anaerosomatales bacterium]
MTERHGAYEVARDVSDRAVLVGVDRGKHGWPIEEDMAELARLADTAGAEIVGTVVQRLDRPNPRTFIGPGKAEEVARLAADTRATLVVFDDDLSPSQQANIEAAMPGVKVLDRTALILDIFALHATSREGKLQVELAQMEYLLPRLRGLWRHLERTGAAAGGALGIGTRGPGETQLETDRRLARRRIQELKRELAAVERARATQRHGRARSTIFRVALVGYTNAGKSTLLNALTGADALVEDMLFATLDATTRRLELPEGRVITLTDTVGFINKLPHSLVEAFKSTLDEVAEADLLLHVVDASHPMARAQISAVAEVLGEIGASATPTLMVYNKADVLPAAERAQLAAATPHAVIVSARTGDGLPGLLERVAREAARGDRTYSLLVPYTRGDVVRTLHEQARIIAEEHMPEGTRIDARVPEALLDGVREFLIESAEEGVDVGPR